MSRIEHILILLQEAGYEYEELVDVDKKLKEVLQELSIDQQEREVLQEIQSDINQRLETAVEIAFENQLFADADAQAFNYDVGRGGHGGYGGRGGHGGQGGHGGHGGHGGNAEHGGNGEYGGHGEYGGNSGSNDSRGGA